MNFAYFDIFSYGTVGQLLMLGQFGMIVNSSLLKLYLFYENIWPELNIVILHSQLLYAHKLLHECNGTLKHRESLALITVMAICLSLFKKVLCLQK